MSRAMASRQLLSNKISPCPLRIVMGKQDSPLVSPGLNPSVLLTAVVPAWPTSHSLSLTRPGLGRTRKAVTCMDVPLARPALDPSLHRGALGQAWPPALHSYWPDPHFCQLCQSSLSLRYKPFFLTDEHDANSAFLRFNANAMRCT